MHSNKGWHGQVISGAFPLYWPNSDETRTSRSLSTDFPHYGQHGNQLCWTEISKFCVFYCTVLDIIVAVTQGACFVCKAGGKLMTETMANVTELQRDCFTMRMRWYSFQFYASHILTACWWRHHWISSGRTGEARDASQPIYEWKLRHYSSPLKISELVNLNSPTCCMLIFFQIL